MSTSPTPKIVHVLCGPPGSGKSTWAAGIRDSYVVSADDYFTDTDGQYRFDRYSLYAL